MVRQCWLPHPAQLLCFGLGAKDKLMPVEIR
jgi:hypothetical protein